MAHAMQMKISLQDALQLIRSSCLQGLLCFSAFISTTSEIDSIAGISIIVLIRENVLKIFIKFFIKIFKDFYQIFYKLVVLNIIDYSNADKIYIITYIITYNL